MVELLSSYVLLSGSAGMKSTSLQKNALLVAVLSSFLTPFMGSSIIVSLPTLGRDLSMNVILLSWVSTAYLLAAAACLVPFGRASDIYGRKKIFIAGVALDTVSSLVGALSTSSAMLLGARVFQGIGGAMIFSFGVAIVSAVYPPEKRGRVLGITIATVYIGLSSGPVIGGFLTGHLGWRSIFLLNACIGMTILTATLWKLKGEWAPAREESFDFWGSLIYVTALIMVMYGLSEMPVPHAFMFVTLGMAAAVAFIFWELRMTYPVLDIKLFRRNRTFLFSNLAALINYCATFAVSFLVSLYLQYIKGLSPQASGMVLVFQPIMMALFSPLAGRLSDRVEPRICASAGMAVIAVGLGFFAFLSPETHFVSIIVNQMLLGVGFAFFSSPNTNAVMSSVDKRHFGIASGTLATMRLTGQMLSMGAVMVIFASFHVSTVMISPAYYGTFLASTRTAFVVFATACLLGVFSSLARGRKPAIPRD